MKANGRRAWRKFMRRERQRGIDPGASWGLCKERTGAARRHHGASWAGCDLPDHPTVPAPRPFTARSLVGMSMSARKRAARLACCIAVLNHGSDGAAALWARVRARYRIGQRLRPCPGCCACKSRRVRWREIKRRLPVSGPELIAKRAWVCGVVVYASEPTMIGGPLDLHRHCDGSGVLPGGRR